jgi:pyroglutamyl-peptidase
VVKSGADTLHTTLPIDRIVARLKEIGVPCCTSDDAGAYLCNALLYHSLAAASTQATPHIAGFVHIPAALAAGVCDPGETAECRLTWPMAVAGGLEIIAACLEKAPA